MNSFNFLPESEALVAPRAPVQQLEPAFKPSSPSRWRWLWLFLAVSVLTLVVLTSIGAGYVITGALRVRTAVEAGQAAAETADFEAAEGALEQALTGLNNMQTGFSLVGYLRPLPWLGDQLQAGKLTVKASLETVKVLLGGVDVAEEVLQVTSTAAGVATEARPYAELTDEERKSLLTSLAGSLPQLRDMQVRLRLAEADLARLDDYELTPTFAKFIQPLRELIPQLATSVDVLVPFAAMAPEFAGLNTDKQFLILFLNNDELRPGGGFIGVYGLMVMRDGEIQSLLTEDSYAVDGLAPATAGYHVAPPQAFIDYLDQPHWYFRDAAWSPDFSSTATTATTLMRQQIAFAAQPVPDISGVIGITPPFIARLLEIVGPITVDGQTFTSANVAELLEYQVEQHYAVIGLPPDERKAIVSLLTTELVDKLLALPPAKWPELFAVFHTAFDEKELALMSNHEKTQAALIDNGWAGVINPKAADDVLMVVDANLAAYKTDSVVAKSTAYTIAKTASGYRATATMTYKHNGGFDWRTTRYRTYTRVYAPLGSTLVSASGALRNDKINNPTLAPGAVTVTEDLGMTSFGAFIAVEPGETGTLSFTYDLPVDVTAAIRQGTYTLQVLKQIGQGDNSLTLDLDFGNTLVSASPAEDPSAFGDDVYHIVMPLATDVLFNVATR